MALKTAGRHLLAVVMWLVSSALGGVLVVQTSQALQVIAAVLLPDDPLQEVMTRRQPVAVARFSLVLLAVAWVVAIVVFLVRYLGAADNASRDLWRLFARITTAELVLLGVGLAIGRWLPQFVLGWT